VVSRVSRDVEVDYVPYTTLYANLGGTISKTTTFFTNLKWYFQVNWTSDVSVADLENYQLPDVIVPTNVSDPKFCQVALATEKKVEFSFHVKW